jgi:2-phosphosulfolactate phosphatase
MSRPLNVHLLPALFDPDELRTGIAVMIDVLRASTTIIHALAAGAKAVLPLTEVAATLQEANRHAEGTVVTGGERSGERIAGFDLDNSPLSYTNQTVAAKTVLFTTTNGTQAIERCRRAESVLIGAFVNLDAIRSALSGADSPIHLVCAGTDGQITTEDALCAGAIVQRLSSAATGPATFQLNDEARMSADLFSVSGRNSSALLAALRESHGGRNLVRLGYDDDISRSAAVDLFDVVPQYNPHTRLITPADLAG